jgi:hypothetical protein
LQNQALQRDFDVQSANEFNDFQPNSLRQRNREFANTDQGIFFKEQGILIAGAAKPAELQTLGRAAN